MEWTAELMQLSASATVREYTYHLGRQLMPSTSGPRRDNKPDRMPTFYPGEPVFLRVDTTNTGDQDRWVAAPLGIWDLIVTDEDGQPAPLNAYGRWLEGPVGRSRLFWNPPTVHLRGGQSYTEAYDVCVVHDLSLPGRYILRLSRTAPVEEGGEPVTALSPPLEIEVADVASPWRSLGKLQWEENAAYRYDAAKTAKTLAWFIADKLADSATEDPDERVRDTALSELKELRDELDEMVKRAETTRPRAEAMDTEPPFLRELSAPGPVWPEPSAGGPAALQKSRQRTASLTSYRFGADIRIQNGSVANGEFVRWGPSITGSASQAQRGQWHLRSETTLNLGPVTAAQATTEGGVSEVLVVTPRLAWLYWETANQATRIDGAQLLSKVGVERVARSLLEQRLQADVVAWVMLMDPSTAQLVATETVGTPAGARETLHVIEGQPVEWLFPNADKQHRDKLPIEPLLRITVGADGFPRHVLVQRYAPSSAVLELTVTDYELNPDLPDDLFEFKPPEGVQVMEADPSNWK